MVEAVIGMSPPGGPVNVYVNVGSSPFPFTQMLTVVVPEAGRVTVSGEPCAPQLFPSVRSPMKFTLIGMDDAAVVGSTTTMSFPLTAGDAALREITSSDTSNGTITKGTGFDSAPGAPGFWTSTVRLAAVSTSAGFNAVVQLVAMVQVVLRGAPFKRITEAELPLPATKFMPSTVRGKPSTAPAITLEGRITSINGPEVMAIVLAADFVASA